MNSMSPRLTQMSTADTTNSPWPTRIVAADPKRSDAQPKTGDSAHMPAMWRLMITPTSDSDAWWPVMCSGAMDISVTMTKCATATVAWPAMTRSLPSGRRMPADASSSPVPVAGSAALSVTDAAALADAGSSASSTFSTFRVSPASVRRAISSGSGRSITAYRAVASSCAMIVIRKGPVSSGNPSALAGPPDGASSSGPVTAPTVVDHITAESIRPRRCGSAASAAANRAWNPTADPTPRTSMPGISRAVSPIAAAMVAVAAPMAARADPVARDTPRPLAMASRASGTEAIAAPRVLRVAAMPDSSGDPETSAIINAPTLTAEPTPRPPSIWPRTSTTITRVRVACGTWPEERWFMTGT